MKLETGWSDSTLIGFDLETSGKYPLDAEICEMAAVKWRGGKIIDEFQSLVAVKKKMSDEVIGIHHITNEMLIGAPSLRDTVKKFRTFIDDGFMIAHHAPFDLGFMAHEFDKLGLPLPTAPVFCSSILSRRAFPQSANHRLQTLIQFFKLPQGAAHRALDDAKACLEVALRCFEKIGPTATIQTVLDYQTTQLSWAQFSTKHLRSNPVFNVLMQALETQQDVQIVYQGGSRPGEARTVKPLGLVRTPIERAGIVNAEGGGDFFVANEEGGDNIPKRYFLKKITGANF
jgi:DNA polymerase III subunit epsilon